jgi:hypothetical protein
MLDEEGVSIHSIVAPVVRGRGRSTDDAGKSSGEVEDVVSSFVVLGSTPAINAAMGNLRRRFPGSGSVTIEGDEGDDD